MTQFGYDKDRLKRLWLAGYTHVASWYEDTPAAGRVHKFRAVHAHSQGAYPQGSKLIPLPRP